MGRGDKRPPHPLTPPAHGYHETPPRAQLPDILAELDGADLVAIYRAARLLAIVPRDDELFTHQRRQSALALARGGCDPRDVGLDPEALGGGWLLDLPLAPHTPPTPPSQPRSGASSEYI